MTDPRVRIVTAADTADLAQVARLFTEYAEWLAPFVVHTTIARELESLPAPFAEPGGRLFVAAEPNGPVCGCVGIQRHSDNEAEIKRLYLRPECRGTGLGHALFAAALDAAIELGYQYVLVSTIPSHMATANAMYDRLGFVETEIFEDHTHAETDIRYLRLDLATRGR